jgi:hypothetical protein
MIVLKEKPLEETLENLSKSRKIIIAGCNGCAGIYQVGGEKQAVMTAKLLEMAGKLRSNNWEFTAATTLRQCDGQIVATTLKPIAEGCDTILSLACGVGVQTLVEVFGDKIVIPGNDTMFLGSQDRELGMFHERCRACGDCIIFETGGICPITRCAKGLLNGPCGGMYDGKCEVGRYQRDCAWVLIYNRLKELGMLDLYMSYKPARDNSKLNVEPREIVWVKT